MKWTIAKPAAPAPETAGDNDDSVAEAPAAAAPQLRPESEADKRRKESLELKTSIHRGLLDKINLGALDQMPRDQVKSQIGDIISELLIDRQQVLNRAEREALTDDVLNELLGLGPLEPLLQDETITDILVNGPTVVFVERHGLLERVETEFQGEKHLMRIIQKIVSAVGRRIDESTPYVDARLADGSRVNAIVAPLAVDGSLLSIRKFAKKRIGIQRLIELGSVPEQMAQVMEAVVAARRNVLISGGTGSGKTTLLNAMSSFIDEKERIVTIEDSAELQLQQVHVARLETRPANIEGTGEVTQRELVKNALRMRPDRIIVGEVRAGEAFDMLQAMNTGHDGSMTTVHANTPRDALSRLEQMIGMSGIDMPQSSTRAQIASAINVVVQVARLADGHRRVVSLSEITGMEGPTVTMQEIYRYRITGRGEDGTVHGKFEATGIRPKFHADAVAAGIDLPAELFRPDFTME
ncbi:CpaF family protein [Alteriqipengyuania sp. WL0013]|uniref:CpaF family protein n=1 Tax=Alteriqipengyuania sp. WL0013 TaxID=3110773 RepID=UPI002D1502DB|nr:CpaF family protein [Alteriqipengyuania sp. WL0013]MEB3416404.1 CpaF family protein [Alteriqipengyuania sp. WL0013]